MKFRRSRDSSVGIATRYWMDGPGIEFRWGPDFPHPSRPAPGNHPASCTMGTGSLLGIKLAGEVALNTHPHLAPGLKKDYSYTPTPPLGLRGLFYDELYLYLNFPFASAKKVIAVLMSKHLYIFSSYYP